jgi:hypothetical protein
MRFLGSGVGHRATNLFEPAAANLNEIPMQVDHQDSDDSDDMNTDLPFKNISETEDEVNDEEDDYGYNHNQLIMAEEEEEEEEEWESMYVDE